MPPPSHNITKAATKRNKYKLHCVLSALEAA